MILADFFDALEEVIVGITKIAIMLGLFYGAVYAIWHLCGRPIPKPSDSESHNEIVRKELDQKQARK